MFSYTGFTPEQVDRLRESSPSTWCAQAACAWLASTAATWTSSGRHAMAAVLSRRGLLIPSGKPRSGGAFCFSLAILSGGALWI